MTYALSVVCFIMESFIVSITMQLIEMRHNYSSYRKTFKMQNETTFEREKYISYSCRHISRAGPSQSTLGVVANFFRLESRTLRFSREVHCFW
jgi:hypothetical protein